MANPNSDASDEAKAVDAKTAKKPIDLKALDITVDRSRHFSEIHGEDPNGFIQDGLPFDKGGRLNIPQLERSEFAAGKTALMKRLERLAKEEEEAIKHPVADTTNPAPVSGLVIDDDPDAHINLVDWAKGKIKVQPHRIYAIAQRRLGKRYQTLRDVTDEMVKRKMLLADEVKVA